MRTFVAICLSAMLLLPQHAAASPQATSWIDGHGSRVRLLVGGSPKSDGSIERFAALQIELEPGWKTYWRQPGPAGGIPPVIQWSASTNLKQAKLMFPAPARLPDRYGITYGYKNSVTLPIALEPIASNQPIRLVVHAFFGVCREICVPAQANFDVSLTPSKFYASPPDLTLALARLPMDEAKNAVSGGPKLASWKVHTGKKQPSLYVDVAHRNGTEGADLFAERIIADGRRMGLPLAQAMPSPRSGTLRYRIDIKDAEQWRDAKNHGIVLTMVGPDGAREARINVSN